MTLQGVSLGDIEGVPDFSKMELGTTRFERFVTSACQ